MAAPALCRAFSQNAWRRDLCSNCFRSKEEHRAAAAARQKSPLDAARLASTSAVKSILKGSARYSSNSIGKKGRSGVSFHKEESQVIGYGGDDEIHSADEEGEMEEVEAPNEGDQEREKAEQQALERLTKANTDFNSVIANLQLENIIQEKQTPVKGSASGIPVPGGRSLYTGPLRLGLGTKDNDGNKKTLLVSVRPFGSDGEEVGKPPAKTKKTVTNGYGSGVTPNGNSIESKDYSKTAVNGSMTNGYGYSSISSSKEISLKVNVSSNGSESKSTIINNGTSWKGSTSVVGSSTPKVNGNSDTLQANNTVVNGQSKQIEVKVNSAGSEKSSGLEINGGIPEIIPVQNGKVGSLATSNKIGIPVPASRSISQKEHVNEAGSTCGISTEEVSKTNGGLSSPDNHIANGLESDILSKRSLVKEESMNKVMEFSEEESLEVTIEEQVSSADPSLIIATSVSQNYGSNNVSGSDVEKHEQTPVPAERNILFGKAVLSSEEKSLPENETTKSEIAKDDIQGEVEMSFEKVFKAEAAGGSTFQDLRISRSIEVNVKEVKEIVFNSLTEGKHSISEAKCIRSEILTSSQVPSSQALHKSVITKSIISKQEAKHIKNSEEEVATGKKFSIIKASTNASATGAQKVPAVTKRPAPSILKMGVPTGWNSKSGSQKNLNPASNRTGKDSNEEKVSNERANIVNGILKTQPPATATVGQEKSLKPVNTIAKLRANFVNNNLKIIAESAAKIVNGTRYGAKNSLADEIPISKSSVMNLSMRPISTNNTPNNKSFANEDSDLKGQAVKGLEKVSNSSPSSRAKGSGPDIRELLRTPEKEKGETTFPNPTLNKKTSDGKTENMKALENTQEPHEDIKEKIVSDGTNEGSKAEEKMLLTPGLKDLSISQESTSIKKNEFVSELNEASKALTVETVSTENETWVRECVKSVTGMELIYHATQNKEEAISTMTVSSGIKNDTQVEGKSVIHDQIENVKGVSQISEELIEGDLKVNTVEDSPKQESSVKGECIQDKPSPNEKSRKKGIVRRILLKGGNEIYRKAGEMVRSVRRATDSKDEMENTRDTEVQKEARESISCRQVETVEYRSNQKAISSDHQDDILAPAKTAESEVIVSAVAFIEEAINPSISAPSRECIQKLSTSNQEKTTDIAHHSEGDFVTKDSAVILHEELKLPLVLKSEPEKPINVVKPITAALGETHPLVMSPRPSFLHGKVIVGQPPTRNVVGSLSIHDCKTPSASVISTRSERAASMSSVSAVQGMNAPAGQRSRLSSLPASETEVRTSPNVIIPQVVQATLRKPGPIISGVKPAIPAKPSKVLEASAARHGGVSQQHNRPAGERKGSTSMGTPGSVGRSAGKRQAPKPPGMDASQRRGSSSSESTSCQKEVDQKIAIQGLGSLSTGGNQLEACQTEKSVESNAQSCIGVNAEVQNDRIEGNERENITSCCGRKQEADDVEKLMQDQAIHSLVLDTNGEETTHDDSTSAPRGTHFVKNQALNASKSSSRVARETERRQMLLQMQSSHARGPVPQPEECSPEGTSAACVVPDSILQMASNSLTPLSARQRSASLGRGVGVATPRPPLPGGSLGRATGEGAALSIATSSDLENIPLPKIVLASHEEILNPLPAPSVLVSNLVTATTYETPNLEDAENRLRTNSPVRSRSEGSLAIHSVASLSDDSRLVPGATVVETQNSRTPITRGQDMITESPSSINISGKKKRHTVRGFLKFLRRGSLRDDSCGPGYENREEIIGECEPKARPVIVHPLELDGACVEVVKGGGVDVRRRLEEEGAGVMTLEMPKTGESAGGMGCLVLNEQSQNTPRRPTSVPLAPPRPPPVLHSPSSPSLSSSSSSSSGSTPVRPRPPPPPRGMAPVPPSPGGSGQKPARPPPPKPAHLLRLGLIDRGTPTGAVKSSGDGIYANLGEVRATLTPCKPQRTASMREVIPGASGKALGDTPAPRITPRNLQISINDAEIPAPTAAMASNHSINSVGCHSDTISNSASNPIAYTPALKSTLGDTILHTETLNTIKCDKLSWSVGAQVLPNLITPPETCSAVALCAASHSAGTDSSSEEENVSAPPLPLVPPPSPPPPLPLHPPPSPPSHPTSSSSSSSLANPLILPEDSGYESVEFHAVHDSEMTGGRWWAESGMAASRGSVVTTNTDSLEESYEAVVGANHRALADVLAQVCQPNPEEFGAHTPLHWSDFLVEGPKGGILRVVGPVSFHRAALKGKGATTGGDSWRRVTLGVSPCSTADLPQYFRGCACHEGGNTPVGRCTPALRSLSMFHDEIPNRFFSLELGNNTSADAADLVQATVMVFNPLHLYSLKTYLADLMSERKSAQRFPPLPEESNWCNRACLFLLVLLDTLCSLNWCGGEDGLCVIREEARPGPAITEGDGQVADGSHPICPLPRLCILPINTNFQVDSQSCPTMCFQSVATQIAEGIHGDAGTDSFAHVLQCIIALLQGSEDVLSRSRAVLELWLFGPPLFHNVALHASGDKMQEELSEARDTSRWSTKNPLMSLGEMEPSSVEGELSHAAPRRWLDLERAGALRSLAVSALHRGGRIPSPVESGLDSSNGEEGVGLVGKCCRGWRVGEVAGHPSLPTCEEVRLRFLVGTSGSEVAEAWEWLARTDPSSSVSVSLGRTLADVSTRKLTSWSITNDPDDGEAHC